MTPKEAVILAGGLGIRLRSVSGDHLPKPMMPVAGRPFLAWLLDDLCRAGIRHIILAVGHRHEAIVSHFGANYNGMTLDYSIEKYPLGTGGALSKACAHTSDDNLVILNGDSYYNIDIADIFAYHIETNADVTIAVKPLDDCSRYGTISVHQADRISAFAEKGVSRSGTISCGIYVVMRSILDRLKQRPPFSFESDVLSKDVGRLVIRPYIGDGYFVDIGIPDDYQKAQNEFAERIGFDF